MTVLPPTKPDPMEEAVSKHLAKALDGQRGRAGAAFRAAVAFGEEGPPAILLSDERNRIRNMRTLKIWATAASALAACLAVMVTLQVVSHPIDGPKKQPGTIATGNPVTVSPTVSQMDQVELSREVDGGTASSPRLRQRPGHAGSDRAATDAAAKPMVRSE